MFLYKNFHFLGASQIWCKPKNASLSWLNQNIQRRNAANPNADGKIQRGSRKVELLDVQFRPYLDENGIDRSWWKVEKIKFNNEYKYPIVLPKNSPISKLITVWHHKRTGHAEREMTLDKTKSKHLHSGMCVQSL